MKKTSKCFGIISIAMAILFTFAACGGGGDDPYEPAVYVAGYYMDGGVQTACYWVNGVRKSLDKPGTSHYCATAITVADGAVYTTGWYDGDHACYWKDNVKVKDLPGLYANPHAITVANGKVYVSGSYYSSHCYWVDGVRQQPDFNPDHATVRTIALDFGGETPDVYHAGRREEGGIGYACYWKNGELEQPDLSTYPSSWVDHITVVGGTVYAAGWYYYGDNQACLWADGRQKDLEEHGSNGISDICAITASDQGGSPVAYIAGTYEDDDPEYACYWKDGVFKALSLPAGATRSSARAIAVANQGGSPVAYVAGSYKADNELAC